MSSLQQSSVITEKLVPDLEGIFPSLGFGVGGFFCLVRVFGGSGGVGLVWFGFFNVFKASSLQEAA